MQGFLPILPFFLALCSSFLSLKLLIHLGFTFIQQPLTRYRQLVQQILQEYSEQKPANGNIEVETIFDTQRDHYQIVHVGWEGQEWIHSCIIHIDIKGEKIWLQWNGTEDDIAENLVAVGVPKEDIVLGFQSPFMRKFTEYAVG